MFVNYSSAKYQTNEASINFGLEVEYIFQHGFGDFFDCELVLNLFDATLSTLGAEFVRHGDKVMGDLTAGCNSLVPIIKS